ncbi:conserved hypothetical protein [Xenorhabdus bovienii str. Intermedium]|uniref:DNA-binding protein n=1 Tax=Xenorhabdus bovienii str. Intermedium TaxID=1379677 RepID=A0A077QGZ9_XENBV|nr:conserved hypothetical protein [Xenorhabdus bovienii str. Intermedium]
MRPVISITIPFPYLSIKEYCEKTQTSMSTARDMIRDGRLPIRKKTRAKEKVEINMVALTIEAITACDIPISFNA